MKVLVVGGAGYIGSHMVKLLLEAGHDTSTLDSLISGHGDAVVGVADDAVQCAECVAFPRHLAGKIGKQGLEIVGCELHENYPTRNIAQSHGWSIMRVSSSSRCMTVIDAPAISSEVQ